MKTEKSYCRFCGTEEIRVSFETNYFDRKTGKKEVKFVWKCPNLKSCGSQSYCLAVGHKDKFSLLGYRCENCGLSAMDSLGAL